MMVLIWNLTQLRRLSKCHEYMAIFFYFKSTVNQGEKVHKFSTCEKSHQEYVFVKLLQYSDRTVLTTCDILG